MRIAAQGSRRMRLIGMVGAVGVAASLMAAGSAQAAVPSLSWGGEGYAEVTVGPLTFDFELLDFSGPDEITRRQSVDIEVGVSGDTTVCSSSLAAIPLLDAVPLVAGVALPSTDDFDYATVSIPVAARGTYQLRIEGTVSQGSSCYFGTPAVVPFSTTIDLFSIDKDLPGPASTAKVTISSSGPNTLVASTYRKSSPIPIRFTVRDPQKRKDLLYSMCMGDTYDCWFEDAAVKPSSTITRTSTGWVKDWGFWWERASPSSCLSYYWQQPDVSVIMVVSNRDGRVIGRKKHSVRLTCRP